MRNGKKDRILRVLLNTIDKPISKYQIARIAECGESWVGEFIRTLESKGLVKGTEVINKKGLYEYWLENRNEYESRKYLLEDPFKLLSEVQFKKNPGRRYLFGDK